MEDKSLQAADFYSLLGENIRMARKLKGLDQERFGMTIGLSRTSLVNIEKGRQRPSLFQVLMMAHILNTPLLDLIPDKLRFEEDKESNIGMWEDHIESNNHEIHQNDKSRVLEFIAKHHNQ